MAVDYRPQDPGTNADPFPVFQQLRDEDPVHWNENLHGWVLSRYDHVKWVTQADVMSPDRLRPYFKKLPSPEQERLGDLIRYTTLWMIFRDPPEHTRLRGLLIKVFTNPLGETFITSVVGHGGYRNDNQLETLLLQLGCIPV